jgi:hypothetical protein
MLRTNKEEQFTEKKNQSNSSTNTNAKDNSFLFFQHIIEEKLRTPSHLTTLNGFPEISLTESDRILILHNTEYLLNKLGFKIIDHPHPGKYTPYLLQPPANIENFSLKDGCIGGKSADTVFLLNGIEVLTVRLINNYGFPECYLFLEDEKIINEALSKNTSNEIRLGK